MNKYFMLIIFSAIMISACGGTPQTHEFGESDVIVGGEFPENNELVDSEWILTTLDGKPLIEDTNITLAFYPGELSGFAGCNGYGSQYELSGDGSINVLEISSQAEGCVEPQGVLEQESEYLDILWNIAEYSLAGDVLTLTDPESMQTLIYSNRAPFESEPDLLENSNWMLLSSNDFPLIEGTSITLSFMRGEIKGHGGCRSYQGEYQAAGDKIVFPMMMMLGELCEDLELQIQESKFTTWLELSTHYRLLDDQLELNLATGDKLIFEALD